jgi:hypothetical protein
MTLRPLLLRLSVHTREHAWSTLWLPLFLVRPLHIAVVGRRGQVLISFH